MIYCDGGSFSGTRREPTSHQGTELYFSGFYNLNAIIDDLASSLGLLNVCILLGVALGFSLFSQREHAIWTTQGTEFVIGGSSAGGLATYMHLDHWASRLPVTAKV